jgi:hypothetical protein
MVHLPPRHEGPGPPEQGQSAVLMPEIAASYLALPSLLIVDPPHSHEPGQISPEVISMQSEGFSQDWSYDVTSMSTQLDDASAPPPPSSIVVPPSSVQVWSTHRGSGCAGQKQSPNLIEEIASSYRDCSDALTGEEPPQLQSPSHTSPAVMRMQSEALLQDRT